MFSNVEGFFIVEIIACIVQTSYTLESMSQLLYIMYNVIPDSLRDAANINVHERNVIAFEAVNWKINTSTSFLFQLHFRPLALFDDDGRSKRRLPTTTIKCSDSKNIYFYRIIKTTFFFLNIQVYFT